MPEGAVTVWTQPRLQHLFRYYNTRYWAGRLPEYRVMRRRFRKGIAGWYDGPRRRIYLDLRQIPKSEYVKRIVLHEMIHAVAWRSRGHGPKFFYELLMLAGRGSRVAADVWLDMDGSRADLRKLRALERDARGPA